MTSKNNYNTVRGTLNRCMNILRQMRIDELDDIFEEREEYVRLLKQNKEVWDKLEKSLSETQNELFRQFIDTNVDMYASKGFFYYIQGFEDCQTLYQLFRELSGGKIRIPPLDEDQIIEDL
ncbi:MAG: hypothetical protein FIA99_11175 [Ruminiclostridium sp.]|nr:hypothetical protein [Ruminiclostridium sp.]